MNIDKYQHCFIENVSPRKRLDEVLKRKSIDEIWQNGILNDIIPEIRETALDNLERKAIRGIILDGACTAASIGASGVLYHQNPSEALIPVLGVALVGAFAFSALFNTANYAKAKYLKRVYNYGESSEDIKNKIREY